MRSGKARRCALLIEVDDKLHQVELNDEQMMMLLNYVAAMHGGSIRAAENHIQSIYLGLSERE
jgi:hypothetical protein